MTRLKISRTARLVLEAGNRETSLMKVAMEQENFFSNYVLLQKKKKLLEQMGFISLSRVGRLKMITLTEKGKRLYELLKELDDLLEGKVSL